MMRSLDGDKTAYERLLARVAAMVGGYLFNAMGPRARNEDTVNDLVQDVLLAIHRKKHLYRPDMPILPWLFAIARYRLIDHVRAEKRRPVTEAWDESLDWADANNGPLTAERFFELEELLEGLSPRQKEILVLAKAEGVPLADIAAKFNMSLSAVKVTVHRSLHSIRKRKGISKM